MSEPNETKKEDFLQRRKSERKAINADVNIYDNINGLHVGLLVNVASEGIMVIADNEIEKDCIFQYELRLPMEVNHTDKIVVGVDCLWCQPADQKNKFWAGFHIIDISETDHATLEELIQEHGQASLL